MALRIRKSGQAHAYRAEELIAGDNLSLSQDAEGQLVITAAVTGGSHDHDDRYYTEAEVDSFLAGKSDTGHTHDARYYTESEVDSFLAGKSDTGHNHDGRYYTETEINNFNFLADAVLDAPANGEVLQYSVTSWVNRTLAEAGIAAASHDHDADYAAIDHNHDGVYAPAAHSHDLVDLNDVAVQAVNDGEVLAWDSGSSIWINHTAAEAGLATAGHLHDDRYLQLAGDTMTGLLTASGEIAVFDSQGTEHRIEAANDATTGIVIRTLTNGGEIFQVRSSGEAVRFAVEHGAPELRGTSAGWTVTGTAISLAGHGHPASDISAGTFGAGSYTMETLSISNSLHVQGNAVSVAGHTHDDRYYTESEVDSFLAGKSDTGHGHGAGDITPGAFSPGNYSLSGTYTVTSGHVDTTRGLLGGYSTTAGTGTNWGANIWSIGPSWAGSGGGTTFVVSGGSGTQYGLTWLRAGHASEIDAIGEGLYLYQAGNLIGAFGHLHWAIPSGHRLYFDNGSNTYITEGAADALWLTAGANQVVVNASALYADDGQTLGTGSRAWGHFYGTTGEFATSLTVAGNDIPTVTVSSSAPGAGSGKLHFQV